MPLPLEGYRVIDWTIFQQGPVCGAMLADMGADVIKLEDPVNGDPGRTMARAQGQETELPGGRNAYFENNNRGKRSLTLDLKQKRGREIFFKLVATSDVVLQNFRKGVADKLGVGYKDCVKYNPKLIFANGTGFGAAGPEAFEPSSDYAGMARSGMMTLVGESGKPPPPFAPGFADQMGAIMLAYGIVMALLVRERTGVGQEVDGSLLGSMTQLEQLMIAFSLLGRPMTRTDRTKAGSPLWNHYLCSDGKWVAISCLQPDRYWAGFSKAVGREEWIGDPRYQERMARQQHSAELITALDKIFPTKPREEWLEILRANAVVCGPLNYLEDLPNDPQMTDNGFIVDFDHAAIGRTIKIPGIPIQLSKTPGKVRGPAPEFGENTEEILLSLGYTWDDLGQLREGKVI
ncbi:MAG: CoA transferase [Chloroflexi bacterium]|nr:CoA transferase [Chloroflexota bacterium]